MIRTHKYVIECQGYVQAAKHAASMDLGLNEWTWLPKIEYVRASSVNVYVNIVYVDVDTIKEEVMYDSFTE